jgi:hypothetical protein
MDELRNHLSDLRDRAELADIFFDENESSTPVSCCTELGRASD